ncbi:hypothetical protein EO98_09895 [Methanosarcina sp. 2.H.T.1A.6]|nr:hypothetical protein EO97_12875 [Methanosarcina sp. 2.H.T.1A.15]KKG14266.1 hypothetical protein EO94_16280 [Methanosarcina sp. 2.H.T.1A.3]KKG19756.1 hypothetical protein EO98_09895 [Methanosarcina sp. 2.H.T.1A.6]KKG27143.1 hypothetical protein EO96_09300 [Methanosarcina sp. 2.H.T.1A.8]
MICAKCTVYFTLRKVLNILFIDFGTDENGSSPFAIVDNYYVVCQWPGKKRKIKLECGFQQQRSLNFHMLPQYLENECKLPLE